MKKTGPIGVFDSGVGGLTVFKALARRMPGEDLVYFGDTAHVPYGSKSKQTVARYSTEIARFLRGRGVKAIVVACNTSSALALSEIRKAVDVPVVGVIEPGARAAAAAAGGKPVGVIGTEATIASGAYAAAIKALVPGAKVLGAPCPLFVPLVEEGWWRHKVTTEVAREYLRPFSGKIGALVLGCTHYPLLKATIAEVVGPKVALIDSAEETALEVERLLEERGLLRSGPRSGPAAGKRVFWCSDAPDRFLRLAKRLGIGAKTARLHAFE